jgi:DNA-binding NarL/FixJ family response regulator
MRDTIKPKPTAIILEDHKLFAESFSTILESTGLFNRVLIFGDEESLLQFLIKNRDLKQPYLFLDYYLEDSTVTHILDHLKRVRQNAIFIVVSSVSSAAIIKNLLTFKPNGVMSKVDGVNELLDCIYAISKGETYRSPEIESILETAGDIDAVPFTNREIEILRHFAHGLTVDAVAARLNLSRHTIAAHRRKMFEKARVNNIAELLAYTRKVELI